MLLVFKSRSACGPNPRTYVLPTDREVAGKVTLKHIYEIAKIKLEDPPCVLTPLKQMCELTIGVAHSCGIEVSDIQ